LQAVASGEGQQPFIDLTWAPNTEADLAGYYVYRRQETGEWVKITPEPLKTPTFRDDDVVRGDEYQYCVSAVDLRGNESPRSEATAEGVK
jgi:fibronectin type 3 domain-containing protein